MNETADIKKDLDLLRDLTFRLKNDLDGIQNRMGYVELFIDEQGFLSEYEPPHSVKTVRKKKSETSTLCKK